MPHETPKSFPHAGLTRSILGAARRVQDEIEIVEIKALEALNPRHKAQMLTYLRFARKEVGLVLNFWACPLMETGVQRAVLTVQGA